MFATPNGTEHALVSPAILDVGVGFVGREFLVAGKNKGPKGTPRTSDSKKSEKETRKRKKKSGSYRGSISDPLARKTKTLPVELPGPTHKVGGKIKVVNVLGCIRRLKSGKRRV